MGVTIRDGVVEPHHPEPEPNVAIQSHPQMEQVPLYVKYYSFGNFSFAKACYCIHSDFEHILLDAQVSNFGSQSIWHKHSKFSVLTLQILL